jgi:ABC-type transporter Mla MlaB component
MLNYDFEHANGCSHLVLSGRLEDDHIDELERILFNFMSWTSRLSVDLDGVTGISPICLTIFSALLKLCKSSNKVLIFTGKHCKNIMTLYERE